jgi:hypothetical protein
MCYWQRWSFMGTKRKPADEEVRFASTDERTPGTDEAKPPLPATALWKYAGAFRWNGPTDVSGSKHAYLDAPDPD